MAGLMSSIKVLHDEFGMVARALEFSDRLEPRRNPSTWNL